VLTGSTNWTTGGLCTQLNNVLIVEESTIAARYADQWNKLVAAGNAMPASLKTSNAVQTTSGAVSVCYSATANEADLKAILDLIGKAKDGALFLMFMPGQSPILEALLSLAQQNNIYVRGVVSTVTASKSGNIGTIKGQVVKSGSLAQSFHNDVLLPAGISEADRPSWAETDFNVAEIRGAGLIAIVHSKCIVIDPFSDDCAVITGSHNMSVSASQKNDENLVVIRGNKNLAQMYALHTNGVYDHYSWRAFLASGGNANQIYTPLTGWRPGGSRAEELAFWMQTPIPSPPGGPAGHQAATRRIARKSAVAGQRGKKRASAKKTPVRRKRD
jgi:phosphatidylserine/phosphatidylglycerophosphate/cardiolipin synthase-like enzyme